MSTAHKPFQPFTGYVPEPDTVVIYPSSFSARGLPAVRLSNGLFAEVFSGTGGLEEAIDTLPDSGGTVILTPGTYTVSSDFIITKSNINIIGHGHCTVITNDQDMAQGILTFNDVSNLSIRNLRIVSDADFANNALIVINGGAENTINENFQFKNLWLEQFRNNQHGLQFRNINNALWRRVDVQDVEIIYKAASIPGGAIGFLPSSGPGEQGPTVTFVMQELRVRNLRVEGFFNGMDTGGTSNRWEDVWITDSQFLANEFHGARLFHCGEMQVSNCLFEGNDAGAFLDNGSGENETVITGCKFVNNRVVGAYQEEWINGTMTGCIFQGNKYGLWNTSGQNSVVVGCVFSENTQWGWSCDKDDSLTDPGRNVIAVSHASPIRNFIFSGNSVCHNGTEGLRILGAFKQCLFTGNVIAENNTLADGGSASGDEILIGNSTSGTNTRHVQIKGNTIGRVPGQGPVLGNSQIGIHQTGGSTTLSFDGNDFFNLPIAIATVNHAVILTVRNNLFDSCDDIQLGGSNPRIFTGNKVVLGSLVGSQWDANISALEVFTDTTRPVAARAGRLIFNSTTTEVQVDTGSAWVAL